MEDITDFDYRVFKVFKLKDLGQYHDLYVKSDTMQLSNVFEAFISMCI